MGVEYTHGFFVEDLHWRPGWPYVDALQTVLEHMGLTSGAPQLLTASAFSPKPLTRGAEFPPNLRLRFAPCTDPLVVQRVMGPSETRGERRFGITAILGVDFRVQQADSLGIELVRPPLNDGVEIERDDDTEAYPSTWNTTPPETSFDGDDGFTGVYRSAILFHCGKDVPRFQQGSGVVPDPVLRSQLETALNTRLLEAGWIE